MKMGYGFRGTSLEMVAKKSTQLFLLAKQGQLEVIKQQIVADKIFALRPGPDREIFEFIYIIEGQIQRSQDKQIFQAGDYLIVHDLDQEVYFETIANVTLLIMTNSPLFYVEKGHIEELMVLVKEVEEKDQNTEEHCYRLQEIVTRVGQYLGLSDEQLLYLVYAAVLHDIGKKEVPDAVLTKPGPLSEQEWDVMRQHPTWGKEIILTCLKEEKYRHVAQIVAQHHERYDGKGYPLGLAGDKILVSAQILAIADAYDAIVSIRPYKDGIPPDEACRRLADERDKQFRADVVDAFLAVEKVFRKEGVSIPEDELIDEVDQ